MRSVHISGDILRAFASEFGLSKRQVEAVRYALGRHDDKEAATLMGCAPGTHSTHWQRIFAKTNCRSQRDVVAVFAQFAVASVRSRSSK